MSKWNEIRNDFCNEDEKCINIDAWKTGNDNEEGKVIAKVFMNKVEYIDEVARKDSHAQELIRKAMEEIKEIY